MKNAACCLIVFLFMVGCTTSIKSENGSFKESLKPLKPYYYEKTCYRCVDAGLEDTVMVVGTITLGVGGLVGTAALNTAAAGFYPVVCNATIDDAIKEATVRAYTIYSKYRCDQIDEKGIPQLLSVVADPIYKRDKIVGLEIMIKENIPNKEIRHFENYMELDVDEKGAVRICRENVSENEVDLEKIRYIERLKQHHSK